MIPQLAAGLLLAAASSPVHAANVSTSTSTQVNSTHILEAEAERVNTLFHNFIFIIIGSVSVLLLLFWRLLIVLVRYLRLLACLTNDKQRYFVLPNRKYGWLKKHILYAPIWRKRHNREFQLSSAVNMGILPTRAQLFFLICYVAVNVAFCVVKIHWDQAYAVVAVEVRHRSGILAVVNMVPLFLLAARNNPLIRWLDLSFESFNLLHRWIGRVVVLESLLHTLAWLISTGKINGWNDVVDQLTQDPMVTWGLIGTAAVVAMSFQSISAIRHAFYETFKFIHIGLAILAVIGIWYHLHLAGLRQWKLLVTAMVIWGLERTIRTLRLIYRNYGNGGTRALLEALPGNAVRVTVELPRPWRLSPGQHAYIYMPSLAPFESHPFSVAWNETADENIISNDEESMLDRKESDGLDAPQKSSVSFVIRARTGFTYKLLKKAESAPEGRSHAKLYLEGPYGSHHVLHSYGTVMLIAGGIGITHQVPHVRDLVAGYARGTVAIRRLLLVWIVQTPEHLEWIRPWMTQILAMDRRRDILRVMLFISRPRSTKEIQSPSATVQMFPGRPNLATLVDMEIESQVGAMGVSVCGSGSLSDDVRQVVRQRQGKANIDFHEEAFSW